VEERLIQGAVRSYQADVAHGVSLDQWKRSTLPTAKAALGRHNVAWETRHAMDALTRDQTDCGMTLHPSQLL
jgi:hypothetical protein